MHKERFVIAALQSSITQLGLEMCIARVQRLH